MPVATETFKEEISPLIGIDKTLSEFSKILFEIFENIQLIFPKYSGHIF